MNVFLEVKSGPKAGTIYKFDRHDTFTVGRSRQTHFPVPDDGFLSRSHFLIEFNPPACLLKDLGSTNGTKVNGLRVDEARLRNGDLISAGESAFVVRVEENSSDLSKIRCRGCGASFPEGVGIASSDEEEPLIWLCPRCVEQRYRYPKTSPKYLIERKIGGGGMGDVFLARNLAENTPVAIKMMTPSVAASKNAKLRFQREVEVLKDLRHHRIVEYYDMFDFEDQFQLIMEYVDGKNALAWTGALNAPLAVNSAARIGIQLLSALDHAHSRGYVHRDIKPSNLLVMGPHARPKLKLSDFGLAKSFRDNAGFGGLTHQGDIGGSGGFLSPDHIRDFRNVKEAADIYSVAATLYYLMSGKYPFFNFDPNRADAYAMILEHPAVPLRVHRQDVPDAFDRVIRKALEKQPFQRWESASEMAAALRPFVENGQPA